MSKRISLKLLLICIIFFTSISIAVTTALILYFAGHSSLQTAIDVYSELTIQVSVQGAERKLNNTFVALTSVLNFTARQVPDLYASNITLRAALSQAAKNRFLVNDNWATSFVAVSCRYSNGDGLFSRFFPPTAYLYTGTSTVGFWSGPTTTPGLDVLLNQSRAAFNATSILPVPVVPWPNIGAAVANYVRGTPWNSSAALTPTQVQLVEYPPNLAGVGVLGTQSPMIYDMSIAGVRNSSIPLSPLAATSFCTALLVLDQLVLDLMASFGSLAVEANGGGLRSVFLVETVTGRVISHSLGTSSHFVINKTNSGFPLGFVPFNCISSTNFIGCFYNISTYAPYADLKNAIDAGLTINLPLRPHEVRQVKLEDDKIIAFVTPVSLLTTRFLLKMYLIVSSSYFTQDLDSSLQFALGLSIGVAAFISIVGGYIGLMIALSDVEVLSLQMQQDPWKTDDDDRAESSEEATSSSGNVAKGKVVDKSKPTSSDDELNVLGKDEGNNKDLTEKSKATRKDGKKVKKTKDTSTTSSSSSSSSLYCVLDETDQLRQEFNSFRSFVNKIRGFMLASGSRHVTENPAKIFGIFDAASQHEKTNSSTQDISNSAIELRDSIMERSVAVNDPKQAQHDESNNNDIKNGDSALTDVALEEEANKTRQEHQDDGDSKPKKKKKALTFNLDQPQQNDVYATIEGEEPETANRRNNNNNFSDNTEDDAASNLDFNQKSSFTSSSTGSRKSALPPSAKETAAVFSRYVQARLANVKTKTMTELFVVVHVKFMIIKKSTNNKNNANDNNNSSLGIKMASIGKIQEKTKEIPAATNSAKHRPSFAVSIFLENEPRMTDLPVVVLKRTSPAVSEVQSGDAAVSASAMNSQKQDKKIAETQNGLVDVAGYFELVDSVADSSTTPKTPGFPAEDVDDDAVQDHFATSKSKVPSASVQLKQRTGKLIAKASDAIISHSGLSLVEFFGDSMLGCYRIKSLDCKSLMTSRLVNVLDLVQQWLATDECETTSPSDFINEKLAQLSMAADRNDNIEETGETKVDQVEMVPKAKSSKQQKKLPNNNNINSTSSGPPLPFSLKICASLVPDRLRLLTSDQLVGAPVIPLSDRSNSKPLDPSSSVSLSINNMSGAAAATSSFLDLNKSNNNNQNTNNNNYNNNNNNNNNDDKNVHLQRAVTFLGPAVSLAKNIVDQSPIGFLSRAEDMMRDFLASDAERKRREITNRKGSKYRSISRKSQQRQGAESKSFTRVRSRLRKRMFADLEAKHKDSNSEEKFNSPNGNENENDGCANGQRSRRSAHDDEIFDYLDLKCVNASVPFVVLPSSAFALVSEKCEVVSMTSILLRGSSGGNEGAVELRRSGKDGKRNKNNKNNNNNMAKDNVAGSDGKNRKNSSKNLDDDDRSSASTRSEVEEFDHVSRCNVNAEKQKKRQLRYLESIKTSIVRILPKEEAELFEES